MVDTLIAPSLLSITSPALPVQKAPKIGRYGAVPYDHVVLTLKEFETFLQNPHQRNTKKRLDKTTQAGKHFSESSSAHSEIAVAVMTDGTDRRFVIDGHTRRAAWASGKLALPLYGLDAKRYYTYDLDDVRGLYDQYDNYQETKGAVDLVDGSFLNIKAERRSPLMQNGGLMTAYSAIIPSFKSRNPEHVDATTMWLYPALDIIDSEPFKKKMFPAGFFAAMMASVIAYGKDALPFWREYNAWADDVITPTNGKYTGMNLMQHFLSDRRSNTKSRYTIKVMAAQAIDAFEIYRRGETFTTYPDSNVYQTDGVEKFLRHSMLQSAFKLDIAYIQGEIKANKPWSPLGTYSSRHGDSITSVHLKKKKRTRKAKATNGHAERSDIGAVEQAAGEDDHVPTVVL